MTLKLNGSTGGSVSIDAPAATTGNADITFSLPVADGSNGQVLQTNGSGGLSWATAGNSPLVHAYESGSISIPLNTNTEITTYGSEDDPDGVFSSGRFTPNVAGRYLCVAGGNFQMLDKRMKSWIALYKNGTTTVSLNEFVNGGADTSYRVQHATSAIVSCNGSSDFISLFAYQYDYTSVSAVNLQNVSLSIIRIGG